MDRGKFKPLVIRVRGLLVLCLNVFQQGQLREKFLHRLELPREHRQLLQVFEARNSP